MDESNRGLVVAYADPPYIGQAKRHYEGEADYAGEVDHIELIAHLRHDFPDGWALSCSSSSLQEILWICDSMQIKPRIAAWVKPFHAYKRNVRPAYSWEPVVYMGGRNPPTHRAAIPLKGGKATTPKDFVSCNITLQKGLVGVKPEKFCYWLFELLGLQPHDKFVDMFLGSGAVTNAWLKWCDEEGNKDTPT